VDFIAVAQDGLLFESKLGSIEPSEREDRKM
jgi:hypothetical protein